jgi:hypothetical protein
MMLIRAYVETVETLRKPSTGLKHELCDFVGFDLVSRHSENPARD